MFVEILAGPGDNPADMRPPLYPGRYMYDDHTAAFLRHAGLRAGDIPPAPDTTKYAVITMAEAQAEAARLGIVVNVPDPLAPLTEAEALGAVRLLHKLGAHLMKLQVGKKRPVEDAWQHAAALTEDQAVAWLVDGGNIGINLQRSGPSGWLVLDAENGAATALLAGADLMPTARTANSQDPTTTKLGGCHVWMPLPGGTDLATLHPTLQLPLEGGGLVDVLVGTRYIVGPGSRLDMAPGYRYGFPPEWLEAMRADATWSAVMQELEAGNV